MFIKCKCGIWSNCSICFKCSEEKYKTYWRKKYKIRKYDNKVEK